MEELVKQSANPQRYKDDAKHPAALKEIYARVMTFLPDRLTPLIDACQGLLDNLSRLVDRAGTWTGGWGVSWN